MKINLTSIRKMLGLGRRPRSSDPLWDDLSDLSETMIVIDEYMQLSKAFLQVEYSLYQFAEEAGIPIADLSVIVDSKYSSFKDFIDHYRIAYCKDLLEQMPLQAINLYDLAIICGFKDHNEFRTAFRKAAGVTITRYFLNTCREHLSARSSTDNIWPPGLWRENLPDM